MRFRLIALAALGLLAAQGASATSVVIDGKEWRQLTETTGFSWLIANSACGSGVCSGDIGGVSVDGWTWADNSDVQGLFDALIKPDSTQFPTATSTYSAVNDADIANAVTAIFDATSIFNLGGNLYREVRGITRSSTNGTTTMAYLMDNPFVTLADTAAFDTTWPTNLGTGTTGMWLYKPVAAAVPEPGALALFGAGAMAIGFVRRRRRAE